MNGFIRMIGSTILVLNLLVIVSVAQDPDEIPNAYQEAKMKCINRNWTEAITLFEGLLEKYPGNKYEDDAIFWTGYCLEKLPGQSQEKDKVIFRYQIPVDEFELISQPGGFEVRYKEVYCVLDEDLREVVKHEIIRRIGNIPNDDFKFEESILLNLPEGKYTLHLRIEDQNAENLGIFSHEFEVSNL